MTIERGAGHDRSHWPTNAGGPIPGAGLSTPVTFRNDTIFPKHRDATVSSGYFAAEADQANK
jgi:hypothetical protein